jgi:alkylation response protein AidB-like acyl-CoA dehydrogenase
MDFTLTEEQRIIQHTARVLFERECPLALVQAAWKNPAAADTLWQQHLREWLGLTAQPLADTAVFMLEYGRALVPGVFLPSLLAAYVAGAADIALSGTATVAIAGADGCWIPNEDTARYFVPDAAQAQEIVVVSGSPQAPRVAVVAAGQVTLEKIAQLDQLRPQYRVDVSAAGRGREINPQAWQQVAQRALVTVAAELIGVGQHLLDSAVAYAKVREQFGRPIGSFQGLQWKLVDTALELERAAAAVSWAAMCVDAGVAEAPCAVHSAKLEAGSAARRCARTSLQVHGGIGYTWEHGLHYWLRRAYAGDAFMGPSEYHAQRLASLLFAA